MESKKEVNPVACCGVFDSRACLKIAVMNVQKVFGHTDDTTEEERFGVMI